MILGLRTRAPLRTQFQHRSSNSSLAAQRGVFIWEGSQEWDPANNADPIPLPVLTVLSTYYNQTYISTSASGSQDALCLDSYTYNSNNSGPNSDWDACCTFNSSFSCKGYCDLTTSAPIYFETSANYTGSPEDTKIKIYAAHTTSGTGTSISHYEMGQKQLYRFVEKYEDQVLVLGLISTFNMLYAGGFIASRTLGLYYGVPAAAGPDLEQNGSLVLSGYSTDRLQGNFSKETFHRKMDMAKHCPWEIDVASVSTDSQRSSTKFTACVEPSELGLVLPSSVASQFSSSTNSSDLTITLTNGFAAVIPSSLVTIRAASDDDQSPILGGLVNNELRILPSTDTLQCVEHLNSTGDLGWAVGSPANLAAAAGASKTTTASGSKNMGKSAAGRLDPEWVVSGMMFGTTLALILVMIWQSLCVKRCVCSYIA
ncbi:uncharacterized protein PAC_01449 [Phialocephala subalpina]|uniref:Uncharacterized protein n=1 Tax=Phialocephala subalpina TaxID=576137 RepID=A0A1L7WFM4_9HELO|nr:uncharacterized protein PAC_01449 [Phialocephala subalpina]